MSHVANELLYEELREWLGDYGASWKDIMRREDGQAYIMSLQDFCPDNVYLTPVFLPERFQSLSL